MSSELQDKVAIVTGAESGIGAEIAKRFGTSGAKVIVNEFARPQWAADVVQFIKDNGGNAVSVHADVGTEEGAETLFRQAEEHFGVVEILVNNAGINSHDKEVIDLDYDLWLQTLTTNLNGPFLCSRRFLRGIRDVQKSGGKIINITSVHETMPMLGAAEYCASKGGLMMFTKCLALEAAKMHVNVNSIAPGAILTPMNKELKENPKQMEHEKEVIPWGRVGKPEDIASMAVVLASDLSDYMTGTTVFVDGGMLLNVASGPPGRA